nr:hypothetical protein GCM10020092_052400 [Actinoplanes digitatis]
MSRQWVTWCRWLSLAVQNFVSASVGIAVAVALIRGFAARKNGTLGNFWVDLTRITLRILLPICVLATIVFMVAGMVQNLSGGTDVTTLTGATQHITGGPVASQEAIKELGTNGGGFYNVNAAHPFENPTTWTNWLQLFLILLIPFSLPRVFGRMVGQNRQGYAIVAVMGILALASVALTVGFETHGGGTVPQAVGAAMEGKEVRFGIPNSATYAAATTLTSTGSVNSFHDSYTSFGGMMPIVNMMLGEVAPGGVGSGLYGLLILAIITVFVAGLMVGRTPEYLGKKIGAREIKLASLYFLVTPHDRAGRYGGGVRHRQQLDRPERGPARPVRGAVRLHLGGQQQRFRVRSASPSTHPGGTPHWGWPCCSAGSCPWCSSSPWLARWPGRRPPRNPRAPCPPTNPCSSEWSSASPSCWSR